MAKYRKKPVIIEATQWHEGDDPLLGMNVSNKGPKEYSACNERGIIVDVLDGDWIVTDDEHVYVCYPENFEKNYEIVDDYR